MTASDGDSRKSSVRALNVSPHTATDMPASERSRVRVVRATPTTTASMDVSLMRLALGNLLANALRHSPPGSPVEMRVSDMDEPLALVIDVVDQGPGIPDDLLDRLFQRGIHKGRAAPRSPRQGMGLGLYIVHRVMQLHGGQVALVRNGPDGVTMRLIVGQDTDD